MGSYILAAWLLLPFPLLFAVDHYHRMARLNRRSMRIYRRLSMDAAARITELADKCQRVLSPKGGNE